MKVSVEVHKSTICNIYSTVFFTSAGGIDDISVKLLLVAQFIMNAKLMCISFSVKHPHLFRES